MSTPSVDRASYLARQLLTRMRSLECAMLDEAGPAAYLQAARRQELVAKILAIEADTTDGPTVQLVAAAMPPVSPERDWTDREHADLAAFLRIQLGNKIA